VSPQVRGLLDHCKLPSGVWGGAPEEVGFSLFWNFKNHHFCPQHTIRQCISGFGDDAPYKSMFYITLHYILTVNFNEFAFTLGMKVFDHVGLKSQQV